MAKHTDALIAMLLGDAPTTPTLEPWLATADGKRELAAYRRTLGALDRLYKATPRPVAYYCAVATPIGRLLVAATASGLVRVSFRQSEATFLSELRRTFGVDVVRSSQRTAGVVHQLRSYFAGERKAFDIQVDLRQLTPFQRRVLAATARVPSGQVVSYGDIARRIGRPGGGRAVGQALTRNPVPIVIPCHRIVASGGRIGGYAGGLTIKRKLLRLEGALAANG